MKFKTKFDIGGTVYCIVPDNGCGLHELETKNATLDNGAFRIQAVEMNAYWDSDKESLVMHVSYFVVPRLHPSLQGLRLEEASLFNSLKEAREAYVMM